MIAPGVALLGLCAAACGRGAPLPPETAAGELDTTAEQREAMRALEAIGYAGASVEASAASPSGVTLHERERAWNGLNLLVSGHAPEALLYDMSGALLHAWRMPFEVAWPGREPRTFRTIPEAWRRVRVEPNGNLFAIFEGLGLIKIDRDSQLLWTYDGPAHHALDVGPDGRIYVLTRRARMLPRFNTEQPILEDFVTVLDAGGREIESVSLLECFESSPYQQVLETVRKGGDVFHTNAIQFLDGRHAGELEAFAAGNLLISIHRGSRLAVVDLAERRIAWTLSGSWRRQHEPALLDTGTILLFDNQGERRRSRILELDPASGAELWSYREEQPGRFFSATCGTCQRLPNGNTLISETESGRAFEITPAGEIVWEFRNPFRGGEDGTLIAWVFDLIRLAPDFGAEWIEAR